ncbi:MAG: hypothetical protein J6X28_03885, partial [Bacilli bacterium]|nr:hypothetical protein [Bacilli bacterium]
MRQRTKYKISTAILVALLLCITLGYAFLNANLNINGTSSIHNATWNVYWDNVQVTEGSVSATTPTIDTSKTTVSFDITLHQPGDYYEFTVDAVNDGSIDAMIESITSTVNNQAITTLPSYMNYEVTYADKKAIESNHLLRSGETEHYRVRVEYKLDVTPEELPENDQEFAFTFTMNDVQADENAHERKKYIDVEDLKAMAI